MISATGNGAGRAGMTLIELVLVMALLVIVAGVGAPMLGRSTRATVVESEARRIAALIERARAEAMARAVPTRAWLDPAARRAGWEILPGFPAAHSTTPPLRLRDDIEPRLTESIDARPAEAATIATFEPDGSVAGGGAAVVTLADSRGEGRSIRLAGDGWHFEIAAPGHMR